MRQESKTRVPEVAQSLRLAQPAKYRIKVQGWLEPDWSDWMEGLTITTETASHVEPVTTLTGELVDQAALYGVLCRLYNLGVPLLSVEYMASLETPGQNKHQNGTDSA